MMVRQMGQVIKDAILVDSLYELEGTWFAEIAVTGWDHVKILPKVIEVNGCTLGYSAWDSDRMRAIYRSDVLIGRPVRVYGGRS